VFKTAADEAGSLRQTNQALAGAGDSRFATIFDRPPAADFYGQTGARAPLQIDLDGGTRGVFASVRQSFLDDPIRSPADAEWKTVIGLGKRESERYVHPGLLGLLDQARDIGQRWLRTLRTIVAGSIPEYPDHLAQIL
jgi:hypothetical protein